MRKYIGYGKVKSRRTRILLLLLLVVWPLVAWAAARALIVREEVENPDALVVLAGSAFYEERALLAANLFNAKRAPLVVLTNDNQRGGWSVTEQRNPYFVELTRTALTRNGVPNAQIEVLPDAVSSTYDEARELREFATRREFRALQVITSAYHSRRALWILRRVFDGSGVKIGVDPAPPGRQSPAPTAWWLGIQGWQSVAGEYVKLIYYRTRY